MTSKTLIETCMESGVMTSEEIAEALSGRWSHPISRAVVSMIECKIGNVRSLAETPGRIAPNRDELCGAAHHLKELREEILKLVNREKPVEVVK